MSVRIRVRRFGGSLGMIIPRSVAEEMGVREDDALYVSNTPEGMVATPFDPDFSEVMEDAREFMRTHRNAFRELAR